MLNPDGVIVGNYRCSLTGRDLNRNYKTGLRDSFPSVWHTRKMVERYQNACRNCLQPTAFIFEFSHVLVFQAGE